MLINSVFYVKISYNLFLGTHTGGAAAAQRAGATTEAGKLRKCHKWVGLEYRKVCASCVLALYIELLY